MVWDLLVEYGPKVLVWVLAAIGGLIARHVATLTKKVWAQGIISRAWAEIRDAVEEVSQVYVDAIRKARADGKLTEEEKEEAKRMAIESFKSNFGGEEALKRLARALGIADAMSWVESKLEVAVKDAKPLNP